MNRNLVNDEILRRINSGNVRFYSVRKLSSSRFLSRTLNSWISHAQEQRQFCVGVKHGFMRCMKNVVTRCLKAGIVEPEETSTARQQRQRIRKQR
jgi:hypothetical protein